MLYICNKKRVGRYTKAANEFDPLDLKRRESFERHGCYMKFYDNIPFYIQIAMISKKK
jgi:hypothetical protein